MNKKNRYPVYIISKGRYKNPLTANFMKRDGVDFKLVVEPQEAEQYISRFGEKRVLVLPFKNLRLGSIPARNWVWEHSLQNGDKRHWIFDDNIASVKRRAKVQRVRCNAMFALRAIEDFTDRYLNIGISGMHYTMFIPENYKYPPFVLNTRVYSNLLILNSLKYRWRGRYNEDTDLCLQVLSGDWCTILFNSFLIEKIATMTMKGGNSDELYQDDGRLDMSKSLERLWPGIVTTIRRFNRPQHCVDWKRFRNKLERDPDFDFDSLKKVDNYGMNLVCKGKAVGEDIKAMLKSEGV